MEGLLEFTPGNTRTPIQAVRNEMNAILASQAAAREAAGAAGGGGGGGELRRAELMEIMKASHAARAAEEARPPRTAAEKQARAQRNVSRLSNLRGRLRNLERNKTRKNLHNSGTLDYIVISENVVNVFESEVMKKMAEGYILQGGVSVQNGSSKNEIKYFQALVKHKESRNLLANNANLLVI